MVMLPSNTTGVVQGMRAWNGCKAIISEVASAHHGTMSYITIALEECESKYGLPYWFSPEWLIPLDESEETE